jgi:translocation and assembly module TamB
MSRSVCSTLPIRFGGDEVDGIKLVGENFDLNWVRRWLPPDIDIDGAIGFELSASRSALNGSRAEFTLASPLLNIGLQTAGKTIIHPVTELESRAAISDNEINMDWRFSVGSAGSSKGHIEINDWPGTRNIEGSAVLSDIDLSPFMMVTDGVLDARSRLSGKVALNGTISAPLLTGRLQLTDGYLDHENLPQPLQAFELDMDFVGPEASLKGGFTVPAGSGDIAGKVSWREDDWLALLQLKATGLELEPLRGSHVTVAPDLSLVLTPRRATISGDIQIPVARIVLDELPRTAVKISQDTVLAGHTDDSNDFDYELNLHVQLGKEISLFARGATSELSGSVDLIREIDQPLQAHGTIEVDSGRYVAYGQKLEVTEGRFYFNGALTRPSVRLEAVRPLEERNVKVGVRVTGDAMRPEIKLFSQPAMDDNLTLHYLLTGAAPTAGTNLDLVVATAMMQLGLAGAGSKLESVMGKYGISDIQLGATNQAEGTELDISAYISPRLFVRYGISTFDRVNTLRARYRLKNDLFIEAISGATSAIDILYAFDL